jgi:hypothetical protein
MNIKVSDRGMVAYCHSFNLFITYVPLGLSDIFADHTFVGVVDDALALIQHQTKLYLVNYAVIR